jgi:hypothetical protein
MINMCGIRADPCSGTELSKPLRLALKKCINYNNNNNNDYNNLILYYLRAESAAIRPITDTAQCRNK